MAPLARNAATVVLLGEGITAEAVVELQAAGCQIVDLRKDLLALAPLLAPRTAVSLAALPFPEVPHA